MAGNNSPKARCGEMLTTLPVHMGVFSGQLAFSSSWHYFRAYIYLCPLYLHCTCSGALFSKEPRQRGGGGTKGAAQTMGLTCGIIPPT